MFERISRGWSAVKRFYLFILPIRFSLLSLLAIALGFLLADQGRDIFRALAEDRVGAWWFRVLMLIVAANLLAYAIWFWTRHLLRYRPHALKPGDPCLRQTDLLLGEFSGWTKWLPRVFGLLVFLILIGAFLIGTGVSFRANLPSLMWWIIGWLALSAIAYWIVVANRRRFIKGGTTDMYTTVATWKGLSRATRRVLIVSFVIELVLFIWATADPVSWWVIGVAAALVLTIAVWIPLGSFVVAVGETWRVPILTLILVWAFAISRCTFVDNHEIRTLGEVPARQDLETAFKTWHDRMKVLPQYAGGNAEIPVIIVATEGGGIRAAYWTAAVLTSVQDQIPGFADHCFAISAVSGGAFGATVFDTLLARRAEAASLAVDGTQPIPRDPARPLHSEARKVMQFDALSGTLAALAQPDLLQRFLPFGFPDRARALELGWEHGWNEAFDDGDRNLLTRPFVETMQKHPALPNLLMNGTLVESGDRIITSNINLHPSLHFRNAYDSLGQIRRDVRTSTAALLSARFTYVSPAGTIENPEGSGVRGRIVDGGYYEVSGAIAATEVADFVWRKRQSGMKVRPFVVFIDYRTQFRNRKPTDARPFCAAPGECGARWPARSSFFATEVLSPVWAVLNARDARGEQAVGDLAQLMGDGGMVEFRLLPRFVPLPLGWVLSQRAQDSIDWSAACEGGNRTATHAIAERLGVTLPEGWRSVTADAARAQMQKYVPGGVPCERGPESRVLQCAREGCGQTTAERGQKY